MNYYIQGDSANADKIKAAFERLGIDVLDFGFADKTVVYCSIGGCGGCVQCLPYSINLMHILYSHPDYKELELPVEPKFKVGDWIVKKDATTFYGGNYAEQITLIEVDEKGKCIWLSSKTWLRDNDIRLWTIADVKDGDVLALNGKPFIYSHNKYGKNYCYIDDCGQFRASFNLVFKGNCVCPATKQERDLLFSKMREAGYEWDAEKKELKKITKHYDIKNFHAGMPVLVRDLDNHEWNYVLFSHCTKYSNCRFVAGSTIWRQCIPYNDDTKYLLGTTDMPSEEYINW